VSRGQSLRRTGESDVILLAGERLDRVRAALGIARQLTKVGAVSDAEQAVERAQALMGGGVDEGSADLEVFTEARVTGLRQAYENGVAARSHGRRANPFEDPYGADWPGRHSYAAAWSRGRDDWEAMREIRRNGLSGQTPGSSVLEVRLGESRDHRRRMLEHQERVAAEQRAAMARAADPQLKMPLIGEVRRPEPAPPTRRRPRPSKPVQPGLGE
jgi:hypothetical protein